jgi:photosynthetic reaction center cytochrome c subunit
VLTQMKSTLRDMPGIVFLVVSAVSLALAPANLNAQSPAPQPGQAAQPPMDIKGKTASQYYKNVKVLKDIPAVELHPAMEYIMVSLGVGCGYCHDVRHFDNDDKPQKKTARNMMQMTFAINSVVFGRQVRVTCYTCHRGQAMPAASAVLSVEKGPEGTPPAGTYAPIAVPNIVLDSSMAPVRASTPVVPPVVPPAAGGPAAANAAPPVVLPSVDEIFSKYTQALGGPAALKKASTLVQKGTVEMALPPVPGAPPGPPTIGHPAVESYRKAPDKVEVTIHLPGRPSMEGYDGSTAWLQSNISRENTGGEKGVAQEWAEFISGLAFRENHSRLQVDSIEKIGDREAYRVSGFRADGTGFDRVYFDTQTGLLLRTVTYMNSVLGSFPIETNFEDYRDASGIQVAFSNRLVSPEGNRIYKWEQVEVNAPVDDNIFARPAPPPPPAGPAPAVPPAR